MKDMVPWILWTWAALSPVLFRILPGRDAAIACLVVGWAFLPVGTYPESSLAGGGLSSSMHALAVPTASQVNKATAIGLGCLLGLVVFDRRSVEGFRFRWVDLPMVAWSLVPIGSCWANEMPLSEGLTQARYLALAWGVPYLMGRIYLVDAAARARFAVALAATGLAYLPLCALEIVRGPCVYRLLYGPHPYEFEGARRFLGHRPLVFLEHGNQLGIWMASTALAATWIWASGAVKKPGGLPGGVVAGLLIGATVLCQSHASLILLAVALSPFVVARIFGGRVSWKVAVAGFTGLGLLAILGEAVRCGFQPRAIREDVLGFFRGISKTSFTWRLARTEEFLPTAWERPWLGWARPDWRGEGLLFLNPVNLPIELMAIGMYGLVGLAAMVAIWLVPLIRQAWRRGPSFLGPAGGATGALVALVAINAIDGLSNATVALPILAAVGALNRPADEP